MERPLSVVVHAMYVRLEEIPITADRHVVWFSATAQGAFSEFVIRRETNLHKISDSLSYDEGSLVEPVSVAYYGIWKIGGGVKPTDNVVIFGAGPIGLFALKIAKLGGANVFCVDPIEMRRKLADSLGADSSNRSTLG